MNANCRPCDAVEVCYCGSRQQDPNMLYHLNRLHTYPQFGPDQSPGYVRCAEMTARDGLEHNQAERTG